MEEVKTKKCSCCGEVKPTTEFSLSKNRKDGRQAYCKVCAYEKTKASYKANPERRNEHGRRFSKQYYLNNKDKKKAYYGENKVRYASLSAKRRASILLRTPKWLSVEQLKEIETEYALREWCSEVMGEEYHVDHIVPLQGKKVSGLHVPWNLRVIPASKNISKSNKFNPEEGMSMPAM
jgi:hypothetical protein